MLLSTVFLIIFHTCGIFHVTAYDIVLVTPQQNRTYAAGSTTNLSFRWTVPTLSFDHIDVYLLPQTSTSIAETVILNHDVRVLNFTFTFPTYMWGDYWIAVTVAKSYNVVAIHPPRSVRWGDNTFRVEYVACNDATLGHSHCTMNNYCSIEGTCTDCTFCAGALDAFDGVCPSKCGQFSGFSVGDRIPNLPEGDACGGLQDAIGAQEMIGAHLMNNSNAAIQYLPDTLGISHLMTARLSTKLDTLVSMMRNATAVFGSAQQVLQVSRAYVFPPEGTVPLVSLHNEARAARISLAPGVGGNLSELMEFARAAGFDWVYYYATEYLHVSVTRDRCTAPLDLMFLLDTASSSSTRFQTMVCTDGCLSCQ